MKKVICIVLTVCLIALSSMNIYAASKEDLVVFNVRIFNSEEELGAYLESFETRGGKDSLENGNSRSTTIEALIVRNGLTANYCEFYLHWYGNDIYSAFRFKRIVIKNQSILSPVVYATLGDGVNYTYVYPDQAASSGYVYVTHIYVDGNITTVNVESTNLQGYKLASASWLSFSELNGSVTIL